MKPSSKTSEPAAFGISAKMAKALADTWRFRILVETTVRPLSPSQFVDEFGGDLPQIARCFRQLEDWGYVQIVEERLAGRGGASIEHVYGALRQAHFDTPTWERIPRSERDLVSQSILTSYFQRVREAVVAGTFDADVDRHLSWDAVAIDLDGWVQLGRRLDDVLASLPDLEKAAALRLRSSSSLGIPTIVGLASFRSPGSAKLLLEGPRRHKGPANPAEPGANYGLEAKLAKALANKWRSRILMEACLRPLSPSQFVEEVGG